MNVHPSLITHPKFKVFRQGAGPEALEYLFRLWGHCQTKKLGENWGRVNADYVEAICDWKGAPGELFKLLTRDFCGKDGWLKVDGRQQVIVCGWNEHNTALLNSWRNGSSSKGRPPTGGKPTGKPAANPPPTGGKPTENLTGLEGTGGDLTGLDGTGLDGVPNSLSLENWSAYCRFLKLPEWKAEREWSNQQRKNWPGGADRWKAHARHIHVLWKQDGSPDQPPGSNKKAAAAEPDKKAPSKNAAVWALQQEDEALVRDLAEHPANEDCTAFNEQHSAAEARDFQNKKARRREIAALIAKGGVQTSGGQQ